MPPIFLLAFLLNVLSIAILGLGAWLGWSWFAGEWMRTAAGWARVREDWRLWASLALLGWSFLGRQVILLLAARAGRPESAAQRRSGEIVEGVEGARLYVERSGPEHGPTLVLTHGWGLDSTIWNATKDALEPVHRLICWDLPGLGRSSSAPGGVSLTAFAANLRALVQAQGRPVVLVGHSIGGMTIQTLARDFPEMLGCDVAGVVLVNTTYTNPLRTVIFSGLFQGLRAPLLEPLLRLTVALQPLAWLCAWQSYFSGSAHIANRLGFGRYVTRRQLDHTTLLATRNPPGVLARGNLAVFAWDATAALSAMSVPVLVIGSDRDIVTTLPASRTMAETIPHARLQVVPDANHMGFLERGETYHAAIATFVAGLATTGTVINEDGIG